MHLYLQICSLAIFVTVTFGSTVPDGYRGPVKIPDEIALSARFTSGGAATTCTDGLKAAVVLDKCYNSTYTLIRKGLADDVATGHFQAAITDLKKFAIGIGTTSSVVALEDVCIPADFYSVTFSVRWTTVYTESILDDMLMSISNSFYDVRNQSQELPALTTAQFAQNQNQRRIMFEEIKKPIKNMNVSLIEFPKSKEHSHDEKYENACAEWAKHNKTEKRTAKAGLQKLLYMVVQLIATGCDPNRSWQIIRHYSALVSLGIRCEKKEGEQLLIPDDYMEDYLSAAMRLTNEAREAGDLKPLERIPDNLFDSCFKLMYDRLSTFGAWGQSDTMFTSDMVIKNMMSYVVYTINNRLKVEEPSTAPTVRTNTDIENSDSSLNTTARYGWFHIFGYTPDCDSGPDTVIGLRCNTMDNYCYHRLDSRRFSWYENCCHKRVCENIIRIAPTRETFASCCAKCNQFSCKPRFYKNSFLSVPSNYHRTTLIHVFLW